MENTEKNIEIFLKNNYSTELSYAELPIVLLLGSKKVKLQPNVLENNTKILPKNAQVGLNDTCFGLCIGTRYSFQSAYYDAGSDAYHGGISDISYMIKEIKKNTPNHPPAIININHSLNPWRLITNTWDLNITWQFKSAEKKNLAKRSHAKHRVSANPELMINIDTDPGASFALISNNAITNK